MYMYVFYFVSVIGYIKIMMPYPILNEKSFLQLKLVLKHLLVLRAS